MADDDTTSWRLTSDGTWQRHVSKVDVQTELIQRAKSRRAR
jgi:hypothetical protein